MWKVLIVGLGKIGLGYDYKLDPKDYILTHSQAFINHPSFELIGGVDPNPAQRELFTKKYNKPSVSDLKKALKQLKADVVVISLPTEMHYDAIKEIFEHSIPAPIAILCEKPLSYDVNEAKQIVELCSSQNCHLFVNYMRRSDPAIYEIKKRLISGVIAYPIKGVVWYSKGLFNNGSHFFNVLQYWLGNCLDFSIIKKGRMLDNRDPEPDVSMKFHNGEIIFLAHKEECFTHCTVEIIASNGRICLARGGELVTWQKAISDVVFEGYKRIPNQEEIIYSEIGRKSQHHVVEQIALSLQKKDSVICSGKEALQTLEWLATIRNAL